MGNAGLLPLRGRLTGNEGRFPFTGRATTGLCPLVGRLVEGPAVLTGL